MLMLSIMFIACSDTEEKKEQADTKPATEKQVRKVAAPTPKTVTVEKKEQATPEASTTSCDSQLKDYSDFVEEYIVLMKKASKGDASALNRYPALMKKAEKSGKKLQVLHKDGIIDADCWKKYNKINSRMSEAAMEMSGASAKDKAELKNIQKLNDKAVDQAACMQKCQGNSDPMAAATCMQSCM